MIFVVEWDHPAQQFAISQGYDASEFVNVDEITSVVTRFRRCRDIFGDSHGGGGIGVIEASGFTVSDGVATFHGAESGPDALRPAHAVSGEGFVLEGAAALKTALRPSGVTDICVVSTRTHLGFGRFSRISAFSIEIPGRLGVF